MRRRILLVEDEADLATTCERVLRRLGYEVLTVGSRAAGLDALAAGPVALVVADLRLPDGDGLDVVRAATAAAAPVAVMTAFVTPETREAALAAGASAFLAKPFSVSAFAELVRRLAGPAVNGP